MAGCAQLAGRELPSRLPLAALLHADAAASRFVIGSDVVIGTLSALPTSTS
ncbi:hypothetical protein [Bradyrhizobium tropiciagri]|uniref:hypothetical protein n=1 Tax=Bradyrhizobium tropiciagri TaxID=312253 RepID=UPI000A78892D|nr:hypothetical protein [Bradyrhizobium tropiciagri]